MSLGYSLQLANKFTHTKQQDTAILRENALASNINIMLQYRMKHPWKLILLFDFNENVKNSTWTNISNS